MTSLERILALFAAPACNWLFAPTRPRDCMLCYHSVHPSRQFRTCRPEEFGHQLDWLTSHCEVVTLLELLQPRRAGTVLPRVAITFDDGYADNYEHAFPLLLAHEVPATFFLTAGYVERDPVVMARFQMLRRTPLAELEPLRWEQVREMADAGMQIGCHTYSHPSLRHLPAIDVEVELSRSKQLLEDRLGRPIHGLAYPFGKPGCTYGVREVRAAERLGYRFAVTTVRRGLRPSDSEWELPRMSLVRDNTFPFQEQVDGSWDFVGIYNERAPSWFARLLSPRGFRASTYGGTYEELRARIGA